MAEIFLPKNVNLNYLNDSLRSFLSKLEKIYKKGVTVFNLLSFFFKI